jgi:hypothetical protein
MEVDGNTLPSPVREAGLSVAPGTLRFAYPVGF